MSDLLIPLALLLLPLPYFMVRAWRANEFSQHMRWRVVGFDEVTWGVPDRGGLDPVSAMVAFAFAVGLGIAGMIGNVMLIRATRWVDVGPGTGAGLVIVLTVVLFVLGALLFHPVSQHPVVRRLRFTRHHLELDYVREGFDVRASDVREARAVRTLQRIPWEGVRGVDHWPAHDEVVLDVGGEHLRFGPGDETTARDIVAEARRRLAAPSWA
ncbi:MAG: hypothetical protein AAF211_17040, partial [Myxococcota bacterium]